MNAKNNKSDYHYDLFPLQSPPISGLLLRFISKLVQLPIIGDLIANSFFQRLKINDFRQFNPNLLYDGPYFPQVLFDQIKIQNEEVKEINLSFLEMIEKNKQKKEPSSSPNSILDYHQAYLSGKITPLEVAKKFLQQYSLLQKKFPKDLILLHQNEREFLEDAEASTQRYRKGQSLGPFDGVPVAVKDELNQKGFPTTAGTKFLLDPLDQDAEVVARLRKVGALFVGKTNMVEIGMGVTGFNLHYGTPPNPYDVRRGPGGSSSGTATLVGCGLVPLAIGADGGGSIRIPAALSGVVGLKATFGRISEQGAAPLCWSVAHVGPLGRSTDDVALAYLAMAGKDDKDLHTTYFSPPHLQRYFNDNLEGVTLGVDKNWFEDADPKIVETCYALLDQYIQLGARVKEISIPYLSLYRTAHLITIASEMVNSQARYFDEGEQRAKDFSPEIQLNLQLAKRFSAGDYIQAQRIRTFCCQQMKQLFKEIDLLASPTTACFPPLIPDKMKSHGMSDLKLNDQLMRYVQLGNLTGFPAISFPAGFVDLHPSLPVGFHLMARPGEEDLLLLASKLSENFVKRAEGELHFRIH